MKIAAILGVMDELELIERSIQHLYDIGVDVIIACDYGSTDGSERVLERRCGADFRLIPATARGKVKVADDWSRESVRMIHESGADWVLFLDADEFWIPASGHLRDCAALQQADLLSVPRCNVVLGEHGPLLPEVLSPSRYQDLQLHVEVTPDFFGHLQANPDSPWIRYRPVPKIMVKAAGVAAVGFGGHDAAGDSPLRKSTPEDLLIAHLPFSSRARFARKIDNIRTTVAALPEIFVGRTGWHWRRWLALADQGRLDEEFARQVSTPDELARLRRSGAVRTAAEMFGANRAASQ